METIDCDYFVGEEAIERAAAGMGGKNVAPIVFAAVSAFGASPEYERRRAAVAAMHRLCEGSKKFFKTHLSSAMTFLATSINDPSRRVQYEAIQMIGRLGVLYPDKAEQILASFMPTLCARLADTSVCDKVRGHTANALINLVNPETCDADELAPYLQDLLESLCTCLQGASLQVQGPCLTLLGCAAQVSVDTFTPYYSSFMPGVKQILAAISGEQYGEIRGKAMQCIGLIGEAVGDETFAPDALEIMQQLLAAISDSSMNDNTFEYVLPACARISKALGSNFEPFLPFVMTPLFEAASQAIQFSMEDADEDDAGEEVQDEETGLASMVINLGNGQKKKVTMNTHAVQKKAQATKLLYEFTANMKGSLKSYLAPIMDQVFQQVIRAYGICINMILMTPFFMLQPFHADACACH